MNTIQTEIENQTINKIKPNQGVDNGIEDWMECTLGEISIIYNGNSINAKMKAEKYSNCKTGLSYIGTKDVGFDCKINYDNGIKIPFNEPKFKIAPEGSILVCSEGGSAGKKTAFVEKEICFGNKLYAITNEKNYFNGKYVFYFTRYNKFLDSFRNKMNGIIGGVSQRKFSQIIIPLPPLPIQRAIVKKTEELFSSLDRGIADLKKAQEQLVIYRQAVLKKAFEGDFSQMKIIDIADVNTGATPKRGNSDFWENGTIPWVTSTVVNNDFVNEPSELITEEAIKQTNCKLIPKGSLLIAMYGEGKTRGKCSELNIDTATNQALAGITLYEEYKNSKQFVKWFFVKNYEEIRLLSSGGVQPNLNLTIIKNTIIPFPDHKVQIKIVQEIESRLSVCDKVEESITESLEKSEALRQSILKKAFEGKLLSKAEIEQCKAAKGYEPASLLLEKIKAEKKINKATSRKYRIVQN